MTAEPDPAGPHKPKSLSYWLAYLLGLALTAFGIVYLGMLAYAYGSIFYHLGVTDSDPALASPPPDPFGSSIFGLLLPEILLNTVFGLMMVAAGIVLLHASRKPKQSHPVERN